MRVSHVTAFLLLIICSAAFVASSDAALAQTLEGDQFLDGIGETALVARYVLDGNAEDWSRNNRHASVHGAAATYVDDDQFGRVISLDGGVYLELPSDALAGLDTISITGWVHFRSEMPWQRFFDFGQDTSSNFFCTPVGGRSSDGCRARITATGWNAEQGPASRRIALNRWVHLAVVLDAANRTLTTYVDSRRVGRTTGVRCTLEDVLEQGDGSRNRLFVGRSQYATDRTADAKLHDIRIYSIALDDAQVATIRGDANPSDEARASDEEPEASRARSGTPRRVYGAPIVTVADMKVETTVGHLPRLPLMLPAEYEGGVEGPAVRVIWPAPKDNAQVLQEGTYTLTGRIPGADFHPKAIVRVLPLSDPALGAPTRRLEAFPLSAITLNTDEQGRETSLRKNRDKFFRGLAATNPDSFLYMFRDAFGQSQPEDARPLGGWDSQATRLRGHATGHYLSAIAQAYAGCAHDEQSRAEFKHKIDYIVDVLHDLSRTSGKPNSTGGECNSDPATIPMGPGRDRYDSDLTADGIRTDYWNWGAGFISAYPPDQFIMLEQGATYGGGNHQVWAPYYTLHKILAGLLDCYEIVGNKKALEVANDMGLWVHARLRRVPVETRIRMWNRYIAGEFGGMNDSMARLHRITGDGRFLECARMFDNTEFFFGDADHAHGLACNVDTIRGKHANQHIPQITGALGIFRCCQDPSYYHVADNFWHIVRDSYMYSIGGVAGAQRPNNAECFTAEPDSLFRNGFSPSGQNETCATYNLLKLTRRLFLYSPEAKYMDYYEQALYNHILASVAEDNAGNTYHVPLNPGSRKRFGNAGMTGFTCCNGTALESSTKLQDSIYFRNADNTKLYVNLFVPSTLHWRERDVVVTQSTSFPYSDRTRLTIDGEGEGEFTILVRVPEWAESGMHVSINGERLFDEYTPSRYLPLRRAWKTGDTIDLHLPMSFRLQRVMDQPNLASIFYGPVLLAVEEAGPLSDWRQVAINTNDISRSIKGAPGELRFTIDDLRLKPFFETYGRYSVYLNVVAETAHPEQFQSNGNPILGDGSYYSADGAALSFDGKLYIYFGNDRADPWGGGFVMPEYGVMTTDDPESGEWELYRNNLDPDEVFDWATGSNAFAGHVARGADGRFYWYAPVEWKNDQVPDRMAIGVAVSDSPIGPWTDPIGKPLLAWSDVFGDRRQGNSLIDPHVFQDSDGQAYLYWGSWWVASVIKLAPSMTETVGENIRLSGVDGFFEAPWIFKRADTYYMLYDWKVGGTKWTPSNYQAAIGYATASA